MLYYKAKYLIKLLMIDEALIVLNMVVQFNQFEIWCLLAEIYILHKRNLTQGLICLNNAAKNSKYKP